MLEIVAEWSPAAATLQFVTLISAPIALMLARPRPAQASKTGHERSGGRTDWILAVATGLLSLAVSAGLGRPLVGLPPAYHDEFSYLFQAQTLLTGRLTSPGHATHPELFDQMHVLNEGRMASRYYPGTGVWLAPFVALGHPEFTGWLAGALATALTYGIARELGSRTTAVVAATALAVSPGVALFCNTSLSHAPTLLALSLFLLGVTRWRRTRRGSDATLAGFGLAWAMLCRPMTAAAVGLPFGIDVAVWLIGWSRGASASGRSPRAVVACLLGFGVPLGAGVGAMIAYHVAVTGVWWQSPYQLYTDLYTPRHVYGFDNVVRGEQHLGPKVLDVYDRWAENLTPELALRNLLIRGLSSWIWTLDVVPLLMSLVIVAGASRRMDSRWRLVLAAIGSLHVLHIPYWYVGIMGWHYVFESALLWCLILGAATSAVFADWSVRGWRGLKTWWVAVLSVSVLGAYWMAIPEAGSPGKPRVARAVNSLAYPRRRHAELRDWVLRRIEPPALVLLEQQETTASHLDLVVNTPGLDEPVLFGRQRAGMDLAEIQQAFPGRAVYLACPERRTLRKLSRDELPK